MKKSKSMWFLIVWFFWAFGKDCTLLYSYQTTSDFFVFNDLGLAPLFFILTGIVLLLNLASLIYMLKPKVVGLKVALGALAAGVVNTLITMGLGLLNIEGMKQAYVISRESRGLHVSEDSLALIFTPSTLVLTVVASCAVYGLLAYFLTRNRAYFEDGS
ncbi:MAG: hypothetical protein COB04_14320 [Gammaproteobacteria bacterium]|nr:MAG: hypothetical protein COB04_14320 [Gammaproteobacteria bacterium]